jgi:excisionase family DNA binding protein
MLSVNELAQALGISRALAYRLVQERRIPSYRIGRCVRVRKQDVARYLESCKVS